MQRSETSARQRKAAPNDPLQRPRMLFAACLLFCAHVIVWPSESLADLIAVGDHGTPSYRFGLALSAAVTLDSDGKSINLNILPSGGHAGDHVQSVLSRLADFAVLDVDQLGKSGVSADQLAMVRAIVMIQNADGQATILVTHQDKDERQIQDVIQTLFSNIDKLAVLLSATAISDPASALKNLDLELHPAAARFYEETRRSGAATDDGTDHDTSSVDAVAEAAPRSTAKFDIEMDILTRERDRLVEELKTLSAQRESMAQQLGEAERERQVAANKLEALKKNLSENETALAQLRMELKVVRSEHDQTSRHRDELQRRVNSVSFKSVEEAAKSADAMRLRAEKAEARYEEAYQIGEACLQQRQGGSSQARQALLQIEQLEERLLQVTGDHRQCIAELEASAN